MSVAHPPLINLASALPLVFFDDLQVPTMDASWNNPTADPALRKYRFSRLFLWAGGTWAWPGNDDPLAIIFWSRVPIMVMSAALGLLVYLWAGRLWGAGAGFFGLLLYCFNPTVLAHGCLATTDTGASLFIFAFAMSLWRHLKAPAWWTLLLAGLTFGLAQLSKFTSILLIPLAMLIMFLHAPGGAREKIKAFFSIKRPQWMTGLPGYVVVLIAGAFVIWAGYGFEVDSIHEIKVPASDLAFGIGFSIKRVFVEIMKAVPVPPRTYYFGLSRTLVDTAEHYHPLYFLGEVRSEGWWYYYPVLFLIKEPVALLVLMVLAPFVWRKKRGSFRTTLMVSGVIGIGSLVFFMFLNNKNIGIRHILPVYPFLFLVLCRLGSIGSRSLISKASWVLVAIYVANGLISFPDYLVHFNSLVGGPDNGLRYSVVGEDWGQDVAALGDFIEENGIKKIYYNNYGNAYPQAYGVPAEPLSCGQSGPGWYAVHIVDLLRPRKDSPPDCYEMLEKQEPAKVIHHTIYVYRIE